MFVSICAYMYIYTMIRREASPFFILGAPGYENYQQSSSAPYQQSHHHRYQQQQQQQQQCEQQQQYPPQNATWGQKALQDKMGGLQVGGPLVGGPQVGVPRHEQQYSHLQQHMHQQLGGAPNPAHQGGHKGRGEMHPTVPNGDQFGSLQVGGPQVGGPQVGGPQVGEYGRPPRRFSSVAPPTTQSGMPSLYGTSAARIGPPPGGSPIPQVI